MATSEPNHPVEISTGQGVEEARAQESNMAASASLKLAKKELRSLMKQKLSKVSTNSLDKQSAALFQSIKDFRPYQNSKRIGIYLSMPSGEIQTDAIVRHALENGKQVFVPYLYKPANPPSNTPKSVMEMVSLHSLLDYSSLKKDSWGIPSITAETVDSREAILGGENDGLDLILIPGVAFDLDKGDGSVRRLGHGKGFYDYFLHRYMERHASQATNSGINVFLYGLALEEQLLSTPVPVGEHDNPLHGLLIGDGQVLEGRK